MHGKTGCCGHSTSAQAPRSEGQCCAATKGPDPEMAKGRGCECCPDRCCSGGDQPVYTAAAECGSNKECCTAKGNCNDHHNPHQQKSKGAALNDQMMQKCTVTCECCPNSCGSNGDRKASAGDYQEFKRHHVTNSCCEAKRSSGSGGCGRPAAGQPQMQKCIVTCECSPCSGSSPQQQDHQQQQRASCRCGCSCCGGAGCPCCGGGRGQGGCRCPDCTCGGSCGCCICCGQPGKATPTGQNKPCCKITCQC